MESNKISIKIKTMEDILVELFISINNNILDLKILLMNKLDISIDRQRLVFKGQLLENDKLIKDYNIEEGNVIHLIARINISENNNNNTNENINEPNTEENNNIEENNNNNEENNNNNEENNNNNETNEGMNNINNENSIILNILRNLNDTSENRRNNRFRLIQEKKNGFLINGNESLEIMRQNLVTINQLWNSKNNLDNIISKKIIWPFNFNKRTLEIGQWIDVLDTIDQWLEAEIIDVNKNNNKVKVHYNGWAVRWDEWLTMSSDRISPFKTYTMQNHNSFYQSPNPHTVLDGDNNKIPNIKNDLFDNFKNLKSTLNVCMNNLNSIEDLFIQTNKQNNVNYEINLKKELDDINFKNHIFKKDIKIKKYLIKNNRIQNKDNKFDKIETYSNFSFKDKNIINENNSLKSLKFNVNDSKNDENNDINKDNIDKIENNENDNISSKSIKTNLSNNNFKFDQDECLDENIIIEEKYDMENDFEQSINSNRHNTSNFDTLKAELALKSAQIAPILDRLGRVLTDFSPHFAMLGAKYVTNKNNFQSNISTLTNDGSLNSQVNLGIFNRNWRNQSNNIPVSFTTPNNTINDNQNNHISNNSYNLQSDNQINFQIPLILNQGEINRVNNNNVTGNEGNVDLHIHASVIRNQDENYTKTFRNSGTQTN